MTCYLTEKLSTASDLTHETIASIIGSGPFRYKTFFIAKRSGVGVRAVAQPSREMKALQLMAVDILRPHLPIHGVNHGYVKGRGIRTNALAHVGSRYLLRLDLRDFFPSIGPADLVQHIGRHGTDELRRIAQETIAGLFYWRPRNTDTLQLCLGAPSSPFISNTLLFDIDGAVDRWCREREVTFTRYSDDLIFSTSIPNLLQTVPGMVEAALAEAEYPKLRINLEKTRFSSKKHRRVVTGLVISSQGAISLGRSRKRLIRSMVHRYCQGELNSDQVAQLRGWLSFANDIEPIFAIAMRGLIDRPNKAEG